MSNPSERSTVALRAAPGAVHAAPLADPEARRMVVASAEALAERVGVRLLDLACEDSGIVATIEGPHVVALGFAAELRRLTNAWHRRRHGTPLWSGDEDDT